MKFLRLTTTKGEKAIVNEDDIQTIIEFEYESQIKFIHSTTQLIMFLDIKETVDEIWEMITDFGPFEPAPEGNVVE